MPCIAYLENMMYTLKGAQLHIQPGRQAGRQAGRQTSRKHGAHLNRELSQACCGVDYGRHPLWTWHCKAEGK